MIRFITLKDIETGGDILINMDTISTIIVDANTIVVNAAFGDGNGVIHLDSDSFKKLMVEIGNNYDVIK